MVFAIVACTGLVAVGGAFAAAKTKVTIKAQSDGFFGYVKSEKKTCEISRIVIVLKQKGGSPNPAHDKEIGTDVAQANGDKYMWSTGNTGSTKGKFYAYAPKITGCKAGISKTI